MDRIDRFLTLLMLPLWVVFVFSGPAQASRTTDLPADDDYQQGRQADPLIARLQELLAADKLYMGAVNGILDQNTKGAIQRYRGQLGLSVDDGSPTKLVRRLEADAGMRKMLDRLNRARKETKKADRQALLSNPATRHLVEGSGGDVKRKMFRDSGTCFAAPTAPCLLAEAVDDSQSVERETLRNWAISEILVAQVKAGLNEDARDSLKRMDDPRMVMVALGQIAEAQARAGRVEDSLVSAAAIPDPEKRAMALAAIAEVVGSDRAISLAREAGEALGDLYQQVSVLSSLALTLDRKGKKTKAQHLLKEIEALWAGSKNAAKYRDAAQLIVTAKIKIAGPKAALASVDQVAGASDRKVFTIALAEAQAAAGDPQAALITAKRLTEKRYLPGVLARIAVAQAKKGDLGGARVTLRKARVIGTEIPFPYARSFAASRVVQAMIEINSHSKSPAFDDVLYQAQQIDDPGLRAEAIWVFAESLDGDHDQIKRVKAAALRASAQIQAPLSRAWMYATLASARQKSGAIKEARLMFERGLDAARHMRDSWTRARALTKLASTLVDLDALNAPFDSVQLTPQRPPAR